MDERTRKVLYRYRISKRDILKAAFLVRQHEELGSVPSIQDYWELERGYKLTREWLERSVDILKHMPETTHARRVLENYAFGQLSRGRPGGIVIQFWDRVPNEAICNMAPVAAQVVG